MSEGIQRSRMQHSLDRPPSTPSRLDSFIENRSRYETAQSDLMVYLKWVILLIGLAIVILLLKAMFAAPCAAVGTTGESVCQGESFVTRTRRYIEEVFSGFGKGEKGADAEGRAVEGLRAGGDAEGRRVEGSLSDPSPSEKGSFWGNLLPNLGFGCESWRRLHERLSSQSFSVRPTLPPLPSVEAIRASPAKFGADLAAARRLSAAETRAAAPPEKMLAALASAAGVPDEELRAVENKGAKLPLSESAERARAAEKALAEGPQRDLRLRLNDLSGSFRLLAAKRAQVAALHGRVNAALAELGRCDEAATVTAARRADEARRLENARREAAEAGKRVEALRRSIEEKENSLSEAERRLRNAAAARTARRAAAAAAAAGRPAAEAAIAAKLAAADAADAEAARLEAAYEKDLQGKQILEKELADNQAKEAALRAKLDDLAKFIEISEQALRRRVSREELRRTIESITESKHRDSIEQKLNERLADESAAVAEIFAGDPAEGAKLAEFISKDEAQIKNVLKIYDEFTESLRGFKGGEVSIEEIQKTISDSKAQAADLSTQLAEAVAAGAELRGRVERLASALGAAGSADRARREEARRARAWAAEKKAEIKKFAEEAEQVEKEIKQAEEEAVTEKEKIKAKFEGLDGELEKELGEHRRAVKEVEEAEGIFKNLEDQEAKKGAECAALKGFYLKAAEMVPVLRSHVEEDREKLEELKAGVLRTIDEFVNL